MVLDQTYYEDNDGLAQGTIISNSTFYRDHFSCVYAPGFEEYHPEGTRYESAVAPVSVTHFPYTRCDVFSCNQCAQHVLRYTEFGGYYVDPRGRRINADLIDQG